mgnify:CR=1 FL=1
MSHQSRDVSVNWVALPAVTVPDRLASIAADERGAPLLAVGLERVLEVRLLYSFLKNVGNDISDGTLTITPFFESVDTATNKYKSLVFDQFVVDCLRSYVFALKVRTLDGFRNFAKVHVLAVLLQDDIDLVADVLWVDGRPFDKTPLFVEGSQVLRDARQCFDVLVVVVTNSLRYSIDSGRLA